MTEKVKKSLMTGIPLLLMLLVVKLLGSGEIGIQKAEITENSSPKTKEYYTQPYKGNLGYKELCMYKEIKNLNLIASETKWGVCGRNRTEQLYGMLLRSLRYQNITKKVEDKYGLPRNLLLAMVMQETGGAPMLPNSQDDGGIGICHIQPGVASKFGLKTLDNSKKMVSVEHGKKLRKLIKEHDKNFASLIHFDDRFHPILTIDAVARILKYYMAMEKAEDPVEMAVSYYGGIGKYPKYYFSICRFMEAANDTATIARVREEFNKRNPNLTIAGKQAGFDEYIEYCQNRNLNFNLKNYR